MRNVKQTNKQLRTLTESLHFASSVKQQHHCRLWCFSKIFIKQNGIIGLTITTWEAIVQLRKLQRLISSVVLRVALRLQSFWTLPLHEALAVSSHSRGTSSSFQFSGWKQAGAHSGPTSPEPRTHFQLAVKRIDFNENWTSWTALGSFETWLSLPRVQHTSFRCEHLCVRSPAASSLAGSPEERLKDTTICFSREIDETELTLRFLAAVRTCCVDGPGWAPALSHTEQGDC